MRTLRRGLRADGIAAGERAAGLAPNNMVEAFAGRYVAGYAAHGSEIDAGPLMRRFVAAGAIPLFPAVTKTAGPLAFRQATEDSGWVRDLAGMLAPPASAPTYRPDLVVVPLLGFDRQGGRLGQGGGHYDRTLAALRANGQVTALGLAFADQEIDAIPQDARDQRLDAILTEAEFIVF